MLWIVSCSRQHNSRRWTQCIIHASDVFSKLNPHTIIRLLTHPLCLVRTSIWRNWPLVRAESFPLLSYTLKIALICLATYIGILIHWRHRPRLCPQLPIGTLEEQTEWDAPNPTGPESCLVEASRRISFLHSDNPPPHSLDRSWILRHPESSGYPASTCLTLLGVDGQHSPLSPSLCSCQK